ncbi:MAG: LIC12162 family protein [Candidatus Margulisbacteria bacterium]|jgi:putative transferase (TIGR04331 family)|nr:LIC12162 family protein [Candidatus Margulisiibacteriota bacterium]
MKRFLVTTADERTWNKERPLLFLGEWCKLYQRRQVWAGLDVQVVPYHWDDRHKLQRDHQYLQGLYEELLQELAAKLNELHGSDHSLRYWRILIGPWLLAFVEILFDRWEMVRRAVKEFTPEGVRILGKDRGQLVPNDMTGYLNLSVDDYWNEAIYGSLLREWTTMPIEKVPLNTTDEAPKEREGSTLMGRLKCQLAGISSSLSQLFVRDDEYFFLSTYLPLQQDLQLQRQLGQLPRRWRHRPVPQIQVEWVRRHWQIGRADLEGFPAIIRAMIPCHLPTLYLEGYNALQSLCRKLPWPKKPRLLFTSNSFYADDVFKAWAADKIELGTPLVIGQHGGNYGVGRWESLEDHQVAISDRWLSWGWSDKTRPKIKPVCNIKLVGRDQRWDPSGTALLVGMTIPRYSYRLYSVPVAGQWLNYFENQCRFVAALPSPIRARLTVRLERQDYAWDQKGRWQERYPGVCLDEGQGSIAPLIGGARICVSTHNATTFLETMALNIPTLIFWDPRHYELRDSAVPHFERLKTTGIFHVTPESAAQKLAQVWEDVPAWWASAPVQAARKEFCAVYSRLPEQPLVEIKQVLQHD